VTGRRLIVIIEIEGTSTEDGAPSPAGRYSRYMRANDLKEASGLCRNFILKNGISEDNWAGGYIFDGSQQIAYVMHTGEIRICVENGYRAISWKPR
jgi:hypothetical protein